MYVKMECRLYLSLLLFATFSFGAKAQVDTVYFEGFTGQSGKGMGNTSGVNWTIDASGCPNADAFRVQVSDKFVGTNMDGSGSSGATGYWYSPQVNIAGLSSPFLSVYVSQSATSFEAGDFIQFSYSLNGGSFVEVNKLTGTYSAQYLKTSITPGDSVQIRMAINNNAGSESHHFDHVMVGDSSVCPQPDPVINFTATEQLRAISLNWTNPPSCWDEVLVVASENSISFSPGSSATSYITNTNFKNGMQLSPGEYAMYKGSGAGVTLTNFDRQKQYFFKVFSRNDTVWGNGVEVSLVTTSLVDSIPSSSAGGDCQELFISEYREGSVPYNSLEIYNPTQDSVDLAAYTLNMYSGGSAAVTYSTGMSGKLAPGETFNATTNHPATNATLKASADSLYSFPWAGVFTGDDAVTLEKNGVVIDVIGVVGTDPGNEWSVTGTNGVNGSTNDRTLVRDSTIRKGQTNWGISAASEWMVFPNSDFTSWGNHQMQACSVANPEMNVVYSTGPLDFGAKMINTATVKSYTVDAQNVFDDIEVIAPAAYEISLSPNGMFNDTLIIYGGLTSQVDVYVKFNPLTTGAYLDSIQHVTTGLDTVYAQLNGSAFDPYPHYQIAQINGVDANGVADSNNVQLSLSGVVYGVNLRPAGLQFTMIDATAGINVFSFGGVSSYNVQESDSITVFGSLTQFNGLLEIVPDSIVLHKSGSALKAPLLVTSLSEATESNLVRFEDFYLADATQWTGAGSGFNVDITNGVDTFEVRIDDDVDLFSQAAPAGFFHVNGIGGQYDPSAPYDEGYQLFPRYQSDIEGIPATMISDNDTLDFGQVFIGDTSEVLRYQLDGTYLTQSVMVNAPADFEVSLDSVNFSGSVAVNVNAMGLLNDTIYIRFIPSAFGNVWDSVSNQSDTLAYTYLMAEAKDPFPVYTVDMVNSLKANQQADSLGVNTTLHGIVYGVNLRPAGLQFTLRDNTGGIAVFNASGNLGYTVQEGDSIAVKGMIDQFNGLLEIIPSEISFIATGKTLKQPSLTNVLDESTESDLVRIEEVYLVDPAQWTNSGSGFNVDITNGTDVFEMRIDNDVDIYGQPAPTGYFDIVGIGSQFDNSSPYNTGYQIQPRYQADITELNASLVVLANTSLSFGSVAENDTSAAQYFVVEGEYLLEDLNVTTSAEFPISLTANGGYTDSLHLMHSNGYLRDTVYVRFVPSSNTVFTDSVINIAGAGRVRIDVSGNGFDPYPDYAISDINNNDPNGEADSVNVKGELSGIVYGVNLHPAGLQFTLIDQTGGISVFSGSKKFGYTVKEGDSISVSGTILQFNGLLEIEPDTLEFWSSGHNLKSPVLVTALDESTESNLVEIENVTLVTPSQWKTSGGSFNVDITDGTNTYVMRIDENVDIYGQPAPVNSFDVTGIGTQYDPNIPYLSGYQIMPRYQADIDEAIGVDELQNVNGISIYPNPASSLLHIHTKNVFTEDVILNVYNVSGTLIKVVQAQSAGLPEISIEVSDLVKGTYILQILSRTESEQKVFIVQ
ncbi:MAG: hypothetical protein CMI36_01835 [Owenweeksia sp.]|nr:hypothetical protein [Owenweeksia sp.]